MGVEQNIVGRFSSSTFLEPLEDLSKSALETVAPEAFFSGVGQICVLRAEASLDVVRSRF